MTDTIFFNRKCHVSGQKICHSVCGTLVSQRLWDRTQRNEREEADLQHTHMQQHQHPNAEQTLGTQDAENLEFWVKHGSWTYCSVLQTRLLARFKNKSITKPKNGCTRQERRYPTPTNDDIPNVLRNLSLPEICSLWPLTIHNGDYTHMENDYRQKGGIFRLKWSRLSVEEKLNTLPDIASRQRTRAPYHHLINDSESSYKEFVMRRDDSIQHGQQFNLYDYQQRCYVECCLWPHLYPTRQWCETNFDGVFFWAFQNCERGNQL